MRVGSLVVGCLVFVAASCGGGGNDVADFLEAAAQQAEVAEAASGSTSNDDANVGGVAVPDPDVITPEAPGELEMNTVRIGSQVWRRTLPMTRGQCFVQAETDQLPASSSVWGTLDGDDEIKFSGGVNQQGEGAGLVDDQQTFHWLAGERASNLSEITVVNDYENNIIRGSGVFWNAFTSERAYGSYAFQCESS